MGQLQAPECLRLFLSMDFLQPACEDSRSGWMDGWTGLIITRRSLEFMRVPYVPSSNLSAHPDSYPYRTLCMHWSWVLDVLLRVLAGGVVAGGAGCMLLG